MSTKYAVSSVLGPGDIKMNGSDPQRAPGLVGDTDTQSKHCKIVRC